MRKLIVLLATAATAGSLTGASAQPPAAPAPAQPPTATAGGARYGGQFWIYGGLDAGPAFRIVKFSADVLTAMKP